MARHRNPYHYKVPKARMDTGRLIKWVLAVAAVIALLIGAYVSTRIISVDEYDLRLSDLPDNLKSLRIVFVSDIHQGRWYSQKQVDQLIRKINGLSADIVILGGDYAEDAAGAAAFFRNIPTISARVGVYAVVGDKDLSDEEGTLDTLLSEMKNKGVIGLVDSVAPIKLGKSYLYIVGLDDYRMGFPNVDQVSSQVHQDDFVICVGHSPDLLPAMLDARDKAGNSHWYDVALFGHTHGGQINLFGYTPLRRLRTEVGSHYRAGWFRENRATLLISRGVGTEEIPLRFFASPQIHLITLKKGN